MLINRRICLPFEYSDTIILNDLRVITLSEFNLEELHYSDNIIIHKNDYMKIFNKLTIGCDYVKNPYKRMNLEFLKIFRKQKITRTSFPNLHDDNCILKIGGYHEDDRKKVYCPQWVIDKLELDNMVDNTQIKFIKGIFYFREQFLLPKVSLVHIKRIPYIKYLKIKLNKKDGSKKLYEDCNLDCTYNYSYNIFRDGILSSYTTLKRSSEVDSIISFYLPCLNIYVSGIITKMEVYGTEDISGYGILNSETRIVF